MNEYQREFEAVPKTFKQHSWNGARNRLTEEYGYAVPSDEALDRLSEFDSIIEVGAGKGYWSSNIDTDIDAYDASEYDSYHAPVTIIDAEEMPTIVSDATAECLFLCWPPYGTSMAYDALTAFNGEYVAYVGEGMGGCTGDDEFHRELQHTFECVEQISIPQWMGLHDRLEIWKRV